MKKTLNEVVSTLVLPPYALYLQQPVPYPGRQALAALAFCLLTQLLSRTDLSFGFVPHAHQQLRMPHTKANAYAACHMQALAQSTCKMQAVTHAHYTCHTVSNGTCSILHVSNCISHMQAAATVRCAHPINGLLWHLTHQHACDRASL